MTACHSMQWSVFNTVTPEQYGRRKADDTLKHVFLKQNFSVLIEISLKFVPKGLINNKSSLVQVMTWHQTGAKSLPEPMMTLFTIAYMHH